MWFKNIRAFRLTEALTESPEEIGERLAQVAFKPCQGHEQTSYGFVPPLGRLGDQLTHVAQGNVMVCARKEEKILPATLVKDMVEEKAAEITAREGRGVGRRERQDIKDEVVHTLLPRALSRSSLQFAYLAMKEGWLLVDTAAGNSAEALTQALRKALGSCPVVPFQTVQKPGDLMTSWLLGEQALPEHFELGEDCEMKSFGEEGGTIVFKAHDLFTDEIKSHLEAGMRVTKLALNWRGGITFVMDESWVVRRLKFADNIFEQVGAAEDKIEQFDLDFSVMTHEVAHFLEDLLIAFGGQVESVKSVDEIVAGVEQRAREQSVSAEASALELAF
jgi:recombination associated protein RdgC